MKDTAHTYSAQLWHDVCTNRISNNLKQYNMKSTALIPFLTANLLICVAVIPTIDSVEQAIIFGTGLALSLGCLFLIASEK